MKKKLTRSINDKKILGVCGGLAEYFEIDSTIVRIICVLLCCFNIMAIIAYFVMGFVMPTDDGLV